MEDDTSSNTAPLHMRHLVVPGQVIVTAGSEGGDGFLRGHGTYIEGGLPPDHVHTTDDDNEEDGDAGGDTMENENANFSTAANPRLIAAAAGTLERVNKLITVEPYATMPYRGQVGDLVLGRIVSVQATRWKVYLGSACRDATLPLSGVNLPGGVQRIRTSEDARSMRQLFVEGDLVSAEVQNIQHSDNVLLLHTRSLRYGKLSNGCLVVVPPKLIVRRKQHFVSLSVGVDIILGTNGFVWIQRSVPKSWNVTTDGDAVATASSNNAVNDDETVPLAETLQKLKRMHATTPVLPEERENIARVRNAVEALKLLHCRITPETVMEVYTCSEELEVHVQDMLSPDVVLTITRKTRRQ